MVSERELSCPAGNDQPASGQRLMVKGAYTLSKAINWTDEDGWDRNHHVELAPVFIATARWPATTFLKHYRWGLFTKLPAGKGKTFASSGAARAVLGDWQVNGVFAAFEGRPFSVSAAAGALNAPGNSQTRRQIKSSGAKVGWHRTGAAVL